MIYNNVEPATTLWELWDSPFEGPGMNSRNHIMFGGVGEWFYSGLLGITQTSDSISYQSIIFKPAITTDPRLPFASGSINTPRGKVGLQWSRSASPLSYNYAVSVPVSSVGQVFIPCESSCKGILITEGGNPIWKNNQFVSGVVGVNGASVQDKFIVIVVGSGDFKFSSSNYSFRGQKLSKISILSSK
eukprot:TRINITY_DN2810_c0_g1_i5.p1 TRINITY_DN2810_c0_g1~~TRINITY_DN2810_c0_g1_i5.p1  ORF type:complete len:188 (-),score=56.66 TRINITY_DN2810_c0_g1_i5:95-658(-)